MAPASSKHSPESLGSTGRQCSELYKEIHKINALVTHNLPHGRGKGFNDYIDWLQAFLLKRLNNSK